MKSGFSSRFYYWEPRIADLTAEVDIGHFYPGISASDDTSALKPQPLTSDLIHICTILLLVFIYCRYCTLPSTSTTSTSKSIPMLKMLPLEIFSLFQCSKFYPWKSSLYSPYSNGNMWISALSLADVLPPDLVILHEIRASIYPTYLCPILPTQLKILNNSGQPPTLHDERQYDHGLMN